MDPICAFHCGISHFIIVYVTCVCCGRNRKRLSCYFNERITWVGWSRSGDCAAQLCYCVYRATALNKYTAWGATRVNAQIYLAHLYKSSRGRKAMNKRVFYPEFKWI